MIRYECDKCGTRLTANDPNRFIVKMELYAAAGPVELDTPADADPSQQLDELLEVLAKADPNDVEDRTYRALRFDLCRSCHQTLLRKPLG